jgi:hypothetical protein
MRTVRTPRQLAMSALGVVSLLTVAHGVPAQTGTARQMRIVPETRASRQAGAAPQPHAGRTDLFVAVPLEGPTPGVVFPFGGSHHQVPGVVAVNRAPYFCTPHARAFHDRAAFVAHLRRRHGLDDADIPRAVLVQGGQVRYVGH